MAHLGMAVLALVCHFMPMVGTCEGICDISTRDFACLLESQNAGISKLYYNGTLLNHSYGEHAAQFHRHQLVERVTTTTQRA